MDDDVEAVRAANDRFYRAFESLTVVHHHASHILAAPGEPDPRAS